MGCFFPVSALDFKFFIPLFSHESTNSFFPADDTDLRGLIQDLKFRVQNSGHFPVTFCYKPACRRAGTRIFYGFPLMVQLWADCDAIR